MRTRVRLDPSQLSAALRARSPWGELFRTGRGLVYLPRAEEEPALGLVGPVSIIGYRAVGGPLVELLIERGDHSAAAVLRAVPSLSSVVGTGGTVADAALSSPRSTPLPPVPTTDLAPGRPSTLPPCTPEEEALGAVAVADWQARVTARRVSPPEPPAAPPPPAAPARAALSPPPPAVERPMPVIHPLLSALEHELHEEIQERAAKLTPAALTAYAERQAWLLLRHAGIRREGPVGVVLAPLVERAVADLVGTALELRSRPVRDLAGLAAAVAASVSDLRLLDAPTRPAPAPAPPPRELSPEEEVGADHSPDDEEPTRLYEQADAKEGRLMGRLRNIFGRPSSADAAAARLRGALDSDATRPDADGRTIEVLP